MNDYSVLVDVVWPYIAIVFGVLVAVWVVELLDQPRWRRWADNHFKKGEDDE